jgi:2',3'-cyclic-nucleotide 2'-phosphodiesterase (5'-nucleotidase family)
VNAAPNPVDPSTPPGMPAMSAAADKARAQLHEEIERVRVGVEEMLAEQGDPMDPELRRELDTLHEETRRYVKERVRKSEKRMEKSIRKIDDRTRELEQRIEDVETERQASEVRIHRSTEQMLHSLLLDMRGIADRLERVR